MKLFALGLLAILGSVQAAHLQKQHRQNEDGISVSIYFNLG